MTFEFLDFRRWIEENNYSQAKELMTKSDQILDEISNTKNSEQLNRLHDELEKVEKQITKFYCDFYMSDCEREFKEHLIRQSYYAKDYLEKKASNKSPRQARRTLW